ncbi:DNA mismatch repair protein MutS [Tuwongella immobilis]|uniref:DNA mismatch repair protein MutS n=1 Tax=Tuwongella immobilis TaxID=692036 RepID=A0A6C2YHI8_9BACT|nr:DNA mismatch repair protein MutS [Tuwongella immobilis]VIP00729.1 dna mismatch repair protein : DNA mismatch repair protein MutS OS=Singulisphaera acidiphila (strain ATCC BAA-1392 / DSM 18658 / VKM B-2454 / MOB10) GN=mutS PE=3 SV=1: MutS_I: MutS_II: MutS_III: MutS_IV: MutS_V [Tuwongella immobilis]VTR96876.1 dna mismatch repair protein : DNA mismatch repair protein MutS OS=Singulisphaera acidiphila (strain ATCC BAA-1392 / DSM 18658 / VKM B-2454 / MOB10) GN=mutS PE=3 SV=1: MutS_I: MutS_II: MutS_
MTTPMMQQYHAAKAQHPGMLLLFRMGDFYETFGEDAEIAARVLGLTLTSRDKSMPMAGFPHPALENHLRKLLAAGLRVSICDQVEDPAQAKGLVRREVTRVVTPGTITEDEMLDPRRPNHLLAIVPSRQTVGVAWVELSTGFFFAADFPKSHAADEISRLHAAEALLAQSEFDRLDETLSRRLPRTLASRPDWTFDPETTKAALHSHFQVATMTGYGFHDDQACVIAAGALLIYLQETLKASLKHLRQLRPYRAETVLLLDETTRRSLELTRTLRDGQRDGSLLAVMDRTVTAMGARMLHDAILAPLTDRATIEARLDAVDECVREHTLRSELRELLEQVPDLQRLTSRVSTGRATPRDLTAVGRALRLLPRVKAKITSRKSPLLNELESQIELCPDLRELLDRALADEPPMNPRDGGVIRPGFHRGLDELRDLARNGKDWIARYQAAEITRTNIPSLKVGFNQVFGYYIEITNTHSTKVPPEYIRKQTLKNCERYITPELKEYEEKVLSAEEKSQALEVELFTEIRDAVAGQTARLLNTAEVLATIDFLTGLAELAATRNYVRPQLHDEPILELRDARHPVLDQTLPPGTFVPNDAILGPDVGHFWLITGPNMSGKSTFIRQVALLTLMAHLGSFVPAKAARVGITDRIFTRVGASDELSRGQSTFMVEMTEAANILNNASPRSLVILDEIGRGTSTYDGVSLAWAITEYLHDQIQCRALFATHYHELSQLADSLPRLRNYHVQVRELDHEVIFLHQIGPGSAAKSYGIHVAKLAGVPEMVLQRAGSILGTLETRHQLPTTPRPPVEPRPVPIDMPQPVVVSADPSATDGVTMPPERPRRRRAMPAGPSLFGGVDETGADAHNPQS